MGVFKARETGGESTDCQSETEEAGRTINRFDQQHHQGHQDDQEIVLFCHHHVTLLLSRQRMQQIPSATLPPPSQGGTHSPEGPPKPPRLSTSNLRKLGDGGTASDDGGGGSQPGGGSRKPRRRESHSRRHTLQSGIDYGLLKRMKAIEEERDVLMRGIQTVQRAEEWYNEQLAQVVKRHTKTNNKRKQRERTMISGAREDAKSWSARREPPRTRASRFHRGSQGAAPFSKRKVGNITLSLRLGSHLMQVSKCSLSQHGHVDCCE